VKRKIRSIRSVCLRRSSPSSRLQAKCVSKCQKILFSLTQCSSYNFGKEITLTQLKNHHTLRIVLSSNSSTSPRRLCRISKLRGGTSKGLRTRKVLRTALRQTLLDLSVLSKLIMIVRSRHQSLPL
jgi:hypothetical protein